MTPDQPVSAPAAKPASSSALFVLSLSIVLAAGMVVARCKVIDYPLSSFYTFVYQPEGLLMVLACSYYDLLVWAVVTGIALTLILALRHRPRGCKVVRIGYALWAVTALAFSTANVEMIGMLGAPINYQWIYYSDFFLSFDAQQAIRNELTWERIVGVPLAIAGFFGLAHLTRLALVRIHTRWLRRRTSIFLSITGLVVYFAIAGWYMRWDKNYFRLANPMVALLDSLLAEKVPSIFTMTSTVGDADVAVYSEREVKTTIAQPAAGIRNVIFYVLESTPAEYVETYGGKYPVTPVMTAMEPRSMAFTAAYATAPTTNKSMVSLLCSIYPLVSWHSLTKDMPDAKVVSLAEVLGTQGYRSGFFNSADLRHQDAETFLRSQGFDVTQDHRQRTTDLPGFEDPKWQSMNSSDDAATTHSLVEWIKEAPDKPFFGIVWTMGTHYPYFFHGAQEDYGVGKIRGLNKFLNGMKHADDCLGDLLRTLDELQLTDSTLVVVMGDHGEAFGRHKQWAHASKIYEENVHVPLVFMHPRLFHGEKRDIVCGLHDVAPTVLDILGIDCPGNWQGHSLLPARDADRARKRVFFFAPWSRLLFGYREGTHKYHYDATNEQYEVFDLVADPTEANNLFTSLSRTQKQAKRAEIQNAMAAWVQYQARLVKSIAPPRGN